MLARVTPAKNWFPAAETNQLIWRTQVPQIGSRLECSGKKRLSSAKGDICFVRRGHIRACEGIRSFTCGLLSAGGPMLNLWPLSLSLSFRTHPVDGKR